jgi:hypothetical protein
MDEGTRQRVEFKGQREHDSNWCIATVESLYNDKLNIGWIEIIDYVYAQTKKGVERLRVKELLIQDIIDPKIREVEMNLGMIDLTLDEQSELSKYNYEEIAQ